MVPFQLVIFNGETQHDICVETGGFVKTMNENYANIELRKYMNISEVY